MKRINRRVRFAAVPTVIMAAIPLLSGLCHAQSAANGGISGTVTDPNGNAVEATVRVTRLGKPKTAAQAKSAGNGTFTLTGLPAGTYTICATAIKTGFADGCLWGHQDPVTVVAGQTASGQSVQLETGAQLQVQISDPGGALSQAVAVPAAAGTVKTHVMVGVLTDNRLFISAPVTASGSNMRSHALTVPADRAVSLRLIAHGVTVAKPSAPNTNLSGIDIPVTVSSTATNAPQSFTVKGGGN